jgi:hypothetical protein
MQLLISTPLHLFLLDPANGQASSLRSGDGYYYGITAKNGVVVLTHTGGYLQYFRGHSRPQVTIKNLIQPHQVEWVDENVLVANTGRNCLSVFDEAGNFCKDVYLNSIQRDDKEKNRLGNHFNSVHRDGKKIYVVAHNYERPSEVWTLTWPELEVIGSQVTGAGWAHNIWIGEWGRVVCDSKNGGLKEVTSGRTIWESEEKPVMTRGLAVSKDHIFIGASSINPRLERYWKDGVIWILDRTTLKTVDKIVLPGGGDIHEIRLVGCSDACHNEQILTNKDLEPLKQVSPIIQLAYQMRKSFPSLRRNFFPMSQFVRGAQMAQRLFFFSQKAIRQRPGQMIQRQP